MESKNTNPAFGAHLEPFAGIPTFMRLSATRDLKGVEVAIVGIPFDSATSHRSGARFGPRNIREASMMLWGYHPVLQVAPTRALKIVDYGDIAVVPVDVKATYDSIQQEVGAVLDRGVKVISLGGDHSITLPLLRAHAARLGELAVIHFDSHPDTWDYEYPGFPYSHGTPFRRAIEEGLIDTSAYVQVGIRGPVSSENDWEDARNLGAELLHIDRIYEMGIPAVINEIRAKTGNKPIYVSLDIDSIDPAFAPGTGTPEVGGFSSYQMLQLVRGLRGMNFVGFDLVEVNPAFDHGNITSILAANLVFEFLALLALGQ